MRETTGASRQGAGGQGGGDLSVTALYTAGVWARGGVAGAELLAGPDTEAVFRWVERFLWVVRLLRPRLPRLSASLLARHAILDHLVREDGAAMLLEIGVGLSPRTLVEARRGRRVVEVDLPEMMRARRARLAERGVSLPEGLVQIEGDLLEAAALAAHVEGPATVVVEGVFPYLDRGAREAAWRSIAALLAPAGGRLLFDLTPDEEQPPPGLAGRLLGWLMRRFTKGRGFAAGHVTRAEVLDGLRAAGFVEAGVHDQDAPPPGCALPPAAGPVQTVVFEARA